MAKDLVQAIGPEFTAFCGPSSGVSIIREPFSTFETTPVGPKNLVGRLDRRKKAVEPKLYWTRYDCINDTAWKERRTFGADNSSTRKSHKYEPVCHLRIFGTHREQ